MTPRADFPALLEAFFTERLIRQRAASPHTIASYRDTFRLLLSFAQKRLHKEPSKLNLADLDAAFVGEFLDHLEKERGNSARTRNARLAAVRSFFRYAALRVPECAALIQQVLAIPAKRFTRKPVDFLTRTEIDAILASCDRTTWAGLRDHALLLLAAQSGLRLSELITLRCQDVHLGDGAHVRCLGKGRKERCTPLRKDTVTTLRRWLQLRNGNPQDPLFPSNRSTSLSPDAVQYLLAKHVAAACTQCPSLKAKRVSPHVLRHSAAMDLLHHGVDRTVIALWLGHEHVETTQLYLHANLAMKQRALEKTTPYNQPFVRYRPDDQLLAFLHNL